VQTSRALSRAVEPTKAGAWIEGLLRGSGMVVLHEDDLWQALDAWLVALGDDAFVELLPALRRAFSGFHAPERRAMGEKVQHLGQNMGAKRRPAGARGSTPLDLSRANRVLPVLSQIVGVDLSAHYAEAGPDRAHPAGSSHDDT
jgi:hypothetical protein